MKRFLVHVECDETFEVEAETEAQAKAYAIDTMTSGFNDWKAQILDVKEVEE